jgi:CRISPR/Cas system Type II protein with McrA/HNH and RuvC-like nuclease domain
MFKVSITNSSKNLSWGGSFETELEAQEWLQKQIGKPNRLPERTVSIDSEYEQEDVLEVIEENVLVGQDEEGNDIYELQQTQVRLKAQFTSEIIDITAQYEAEQAKQARLLAGKQAREACQAVLDYVTGYNIDRNLSAEQVTQMQSTFGAILSLLQANRPNSAKALISAIVVDEVVPQELKDGCLDLLSNY